MTASQIIGKLYEAGFDVSFIGPTDPSMDYPTWDDGMPVPMFKLNGVWTYPLAGDYDEILEQVAVNLIELGRDLAALTGR